MNDSAAITGNTALANGGGVAVRSFGALTLNASASITQNRADLDDDGEGVRAASIAGSGR
jgi:hypothetical protein